MNNASSTAPILELVALATAAIKDLEIRGVRPGSGAGTKATSVWAIGKNGQEWQIYSPKGPFAAAQLDGLVRSLGVLTNASRDDLLPFSVPQPKGIVNRKNRELVFIFPALGGEEATELVFKESPLFADSLGRALACLHTLNPKTIAKACGSFMTVNDQRRELTALVKRHAPAIPSGLRTRWLDAIRNESLWQFTPTPVHGSLAAEDVQIAPGGAVVGIKGFENICVSDPAIDVAWMIFYADDNFLETFEASYARARNAGDLHILTRARLRAEMETLRWYDAGVEENDRVWRQEGIEALRELDHDLRGTTLVQPNHEVVQIHFSADEEPLLRVAPNKHVPNRVDAPNHTPSLGQTQSNDSALESADTSAIIATSRVTPDEWGTDNNPATDGSIEVPYPSEDYDSFRFRS